MIKRWVKVFFIFFAAGILFTACPIEYVPVYRGGVGETPGDWQHNVNIPPDFNLPYLEGRAPGYYWWFTPPAVRHLITDVRYVTVTFFFDGDEMTHFEICVEHETTGPAAGHDHERLNEAIAAWKERVEDYGFPGIPAQLPMTNTPATANNPLRYRWSQEDIDAFSGGTITVNALSRAAFYALYDFIDMPANGGACDNQGCDCQNCAGPSCECGDTNGCGAQGCTCQNCTGANCGCDETNGPEVCDCQDCAGATCNCNRLIIVSGLAPGFFYFALSADIPGLSPADFPVTVTLRFNCNGTLESFETDTSEETDYIVEDAVENWETRIRNYGIAGLPPILPFHNYTDVKGPSEHDNPIWTADLLDAFSYATVTVNALTRAAHDALGRLPPGFPGN